MTLVLLDRDGVINFDSEDYIRSPEQFDPIPGSVEAIARLIRAGFQVAVCTNQSGLARGLFTEQTLSEIHAKLHTLLQQYQVALDGIYFCPHSPDCNCDCRKPAPGLLLQALSEQSVSANETWFIGDSLRDMQAALAIGCKPMLVRSGNGTTQEAQVRKLGVNNIHEDLDAAVSWLLLEANNPV